MLMPDVNVLLDAFREDLPAHTRVRPWLTDRLTGFEQIGVSELVLSSVIRISTRVGVWDVPATPGEAIAFCAIVRSAPAATLVAPGPRHWSIFAGLVESMRLRGNDVPDAYFAALALENGATLVTRDRGFARFAGLRLLDPLAG
ncbi:type II toxin-antitoxin system VapC family toxin [Jatrophihabitans endophyticus]|uniref:type II toxin-antitoxin system VapC family toxin n=1 Tax=Jatrophihabitans endophyticus TaxID=1206085 RepID=UPI0019F24EEE|nr:type II toxin-antitoxin system VapC family toxin [Jatrophihabitans endophyticus]MBE7187674.1 type II toxin-antitoxin system VapC family toxin [Jatrophihabitans endophyticus]